jgi:hypothetical protein
MASFAQAMLTVKHWILSAPNNSIFRVAKKMCRPLRGGTAVM